MNFVNKFLTERRTRGRIRALERIRTSLLLVLDLFAKPKPASSSYFPEMLTKRLRQKLCEVQDLWAIIKEKRKKQGHDFFNWAGWPIWYRAFRIVKWSIYKITLN